MVSKKLYYITRARVPSEKAHAFQIVKMCEAYTQSGCNVSLIVPKRQNPITDNIFEYYGVKPNFSFEQIPVPQLIGATWWGRFGYWLEGLIFLYKVRRHVTDTEAVLVTRSIEVALFFSLKKLKRVVFELHDWPQSYTRVFAFILKKIPHVVVTSEGLADVCRQHGIATVVVQNGVDDSFFEPHEPLKRSDFGIPEDKKVVMYIGSLQKWKGVDTLLEAARSFSHEVQVVVIGGTEREVAQLRKSYLHVLFLGQKPTKDLARYQQMSDVLVVPNSTQDEVSFKYTSPIKLFAHLTSQKPVVATRLPAITAIVSEKEVYFFDGTSTDLVRVVNDVLSDGIEVWRKKTEAAFLLSKGFTWKKRAEAILAIV